jgi:hypothetical protein
MPHVCPSVYACPLPPEGRPWGLEGRDKIRRIRMVPKPTQTKPTSECARTMHVHFMPSQPQQTYICTMHIYTVHRGRLSHVTGSTAAARVE